MGGASPRPHGARASEGGAYLGGYQETLEVARTVQRPLRAMALLRVGLK